LSSSSSLCIQCCQCFTQEKKTKKRSKIDQAKTTGDSLGAREG
jgi:chorismate synthase